MFRDDKTPSYDDLVKYIAKVVGLEYDALPELSIVAIIKFLVKYNIKPGDNVVITDDPDNPNGVVISAAGGKGGIKSINDDTTEAQKVVSGDENTLTVVTKDGVTTLTAKGGKAFKTIGGVAATQAEDGLILESPDGTLGIVTDSARKAVQFTVKDFDWRQFCTGLWHFNGNLADELGAVMTRVAQHQSCFCDNFNGNYNGLSKYERYNLASYKFMPSGGVFGTGYLVLTQTQIDSCNASTRTINTGEALTYDYWLNSTLTTIDKSLPLFGNQNNYGDAAYVNMGAGTFMHGTTVLGSFIPAAGWFLLSFELSAGLGAGTEVSTYVNGKYSGTVPVTTALLWDKEVMACKCGPSGQAARDFAIGGMQLRLGHYYNKKDFVVPTKPFELAVSGPVIGYTPGYYAGTKSLLIPNSSMDYYTLADTSKFNIGGNKFNIDFWFNATVNAVDCYIFGYVDTSGNTLWSFRRSSNGVALVIGGVSVEAIITTAGWHHIAFTYDNNTLRAFTDGKLQSAIITAIATCANPSNIQLGSKAAGTDSILADLRILKGYCQWRVDFTPPTQPWSMT